MPKHEFKEADLHIDKCPQCWNEDFWKKQTTWKCGLSFALIELVLCGVLAVLLTLHKRNDINGFKEKYQHLFNKKEKSE